MTKASFSEILVPREATFLTVAQVLQLIAAALKPADPPDEEEQQTIYLHRAIRNGALQTFGATMTAADPAQATAPLARILIGDLMRYLEHTVPTVRLRFYGAAESRQAMAGKLAGDGPATVNRDHAWQEAQIIRSLKALNFKPLALPADDRNNNFYVKSIVRARCGKIHGVRLRAAVFDKAWERMLGSQALAYA